MDSLQAAEYPQPPAGYRFAGLLQFPRIRLQIAAVLLLVVTAPLLFIFILLLHRPPGPEIIFFNNSVADLVLFIITVLATMVVHELTHGIAYKLLGYKVTFGLSVYLLAAYAAVFGQWQKRDHNLIAALTPLIALTVILIPFLAVPNRIVVLVVFMALLINTAGSVGDLYLTWRLLRMPRSTLIYDLDVKTVLIYMPLESTDQQPD